MLPTLRYNFGSIVRGRYPALGHPLPWATPCLWPFRFCLNEKKITLPWAKCRIFFTSLFICNNIDTNLNKNFHTYLSYHSLKFFFFKFLRVVWKNFKTKTGPRQDTFPYLVTIFEDVLSLITINLMSSIQIFPALFISLARLYRPPRVLSTQRRTTFLIKRTSAKSKKTP